VETGDHPSNARLWLLAAVAGPCWGGVWKAIAVLRNVATGAWTMRRRVLRGDLPHAINPCQMHSAKY
jgi:hypothetical protein